MSLDKAQFFTLGLKSDAIWVSALLYYHIISHQAGYRLIRQETRFLKKNLNAPNLLSIFFPPDVGKNIKTFR